jgi:hypothetical protein
VRESGPSWAERGEEEEMGRAGADWAGAREERWAGAAGWAAGLGGGWFPVFFFLGFPIPFLFLFLVFKPKFI